MPSRVLVLLLLGGFCFFSSGIALAQATGDLNDDGKVDAEDVTILEQYLKGSRLLVDQELSQADINQDGKVDSQDLEALQKRLGIASNSPVPITNQRRNQDESFNDASSNKGSKEGKTNTFQLGIAESVPEWVRGEWHFLSTVVEDRGFNDVGLKHNEQITLPGDLSGQYQAYSDDTGERLERLCWQVVESDDRHFIFTEQSRFPSNGAVIRSTSNVTRLEPDQAQIRVRVDVLDPGRAGRSQGFLGELFGAIFGQSRNRSQAGDYYVREGSMSRVPGTEQKRLPDVDLSRLRCS
ncbi:MAG: dockerin type I repeat-containing protein [Gloeobacterales cyanobacterium]